MRHLPYCPALLLAACTSQNPLFGLETETDGTTAASSGHTTTTTPTTAGPTSPTTGEPATSESPGTGNPSEPLTSTGPATTAVDPNTATAVDPNTTSNETNDSDVNSSSTGEPACVLHTHPEFDDRLRINGLLKPVCTQSPMYFHGKLMAGNDELKFNTTGTGCDGEEKYGVLSLGSNYALPILNDSPCAKLYVFRDGDGPDCDIAQFFVVVLDPIETVAVGSFTPEEPVMNGPADLGMIEPNLMPCCTAEAQDCCDDMLGNSSLKVDGTEVLPGNTDPVVYNGKAGRLYNIQYWDTRDCVADVLSRRHDWIGVRP